MCQPLARVLRVERHVGAAGLEHRQQAHQGFQAALGAQRPPACAGHAAVDQAVGQAGWLCLEGGVSQRARANQGNALRMRGGLGREALMQPRAAYCRICLAGLGNRPQRQGFDGPRRLGQGGAQQLRPVLAKALDGAGLEQVGGIQQRGAEALALLLGVQRQVEARGFAGDFQRRQLDAGNCQRLPGGSRPGD
jgi:hypothetical protein